MDPSSSQHQKDFLNSLIPPDNQINNIYSPFLNSASSAQSDNGIPNSPTSTSSSGGPAPQSPNTQLTMSLLNNLLQMQGLENSIVQQQLSTQGQASNPGGAPHNASSPASTASPPPSSYPSQILLEQQIKLSQLQQLQQLQNQIFQQQIALISGQSPSILPTSPIIDMARQAGGGGGGTAGDYTGLPTPATTRIRVSLRSGELHGTPSARLVPPPSNSSTPNQMQQGHSQNHSPNPNMNAVHQHQSTSSSSHTHTRQGSSSGPMGLNIQRQLMALSQSQNQQNQQHSPYHHQPSSPASFQQQHQHQLPHQQATSSPVYHPTSPMHHPVSPMDHTMSPNPFATQQQHRQQQQLSQTHQQQMFSSHNQQHHNATMHPSQHQSRLHNILSAPHSAPERIAFHIFTGSLPGGGTIPGLTLGPAGTPAGVGVGVDGNMSAAENARRASLSESPHHVQQMHQMQILDQDISPLTSPWLGAHPTTTSSSSSSNPNARNVHRSSTSTSTSTSTGTSNKRTASSSGDEGGSARKKQSPAIRPTLGMSIARLWRW
ncbi:hypothetical protein BDZ97DRAFT_2074060 [Flammula alnicola]|nr:hypothetical protein BDZ97DRAFT_2074060 [Flammula alnicola]